MMLRKSIWVTESFAGYHLWKDAPSEVEFLRSSHRHRFHVRLQVAVNHNDRDVEFFILQRQLRDLLRVQFEEVGNIGSCEMIAERILCHFDGIYTVLAVEVSEDGENGAIIEKYR